MKRPIPPTLDEDKVCYLMKSISEEGQQVPIDVLKAPNGKLYGFGGCHRYAALTRINSDKVLVRVRNATSSMMKLYMGASYSDDQ